MISAQIKKPENRKGLGSPYLPIRAVVRKALAITARDTLLTIGLDEPLTSEPGQFLMAGLPGFGEAALSICSPPSKNKTIELCIRNAGSLTGRLCALNKNETIWLRAPLGRGFVMPPKGEDLLFITGGIGIVPARSLIKAVLKKRSSYGKITILYGLKGPKGILFKDEIKEWKKKNVEVLITVDAPSAAWSGRTGVVTTLIGQLKISAPRTTAFAIGPPAMYRYVVPQLARKDISPAKTFFSLERRMRCGLGKCGHCLIGGVYTCLCGPVFSLAELADMPGAI